MKKDDRLPHQISIKFFQIFKQTRELVYPQISDAQEKP